MVGGVGPDRPGLGGQRTTLEFSGNYCAESRTTESAHFKMLATAGVRGRGAGTVQAQVGEEASPHCDRHGEVLLSHQAGESSSQWLPVLSTDWAVSMAGGGEETRGQGCLL